MDAHSCAAEGKPGPLSCLSGSGHPWRREEPSQPIVSYVGYSLKEPWGEPRVVIGIDADEAEYLADFLDRDECAKRGQAALQQIPLQQAVLAEHPQEGGSEYPGSALVGAPAATEQPPATA